MAAMALPDAPRPPAQAPAGQRWGLGAASVAPYLRNAWASPVSNAVFTPGDFASFVWPAAGGDAQARPAKKQH